MGVMCPGYESDQSPPSSAEVNALAYLQPPTRLHGLVLCEAHGQLHLY
jgi:hypothetical protein